MGLCNLLHIFPLSFLSMDAASLWLLPSYLPTFIENHLKLLLEKHLVTAT